MTAPPAPQGSPGKPGPFRTLWRWLASLDLTKPPAPVLRWLGILLIGVVYAALRAPKQNYDWLWPTVLAGALILPDVAGFAVGGFRLDLRKAQEDIAALRLRLDIRQQVINYIYQIAAETELSERAPRRQRIIGGDPDAGSAETGSAQPPTADPDEKKDS